MLAMLYSDIILCLHILYASDVVLRYDSMFIFYARDVVLRYDSMFIFYASDVVLRYYSMFIFYARDVYWDMILCLYSMLEMFI